MDNGRPLSLGRQLREARVRARLKPKDLARKAGVSLAALYNCERADRGGRTKNAYCARFGTWAFSAHS